MAIKPILFNTEMVRAILDDRKTKTRRVIRLQPEYGEEVRLRTNKDGKLVAWFYCENPMLNPTIPSPWGGPEQEARYQPGDILWVRETWNVNNLREKEPGEFEVGFIYAASEAPPNGFRWVKTSEENYQKYEDGMSWHFSGWRPSIHMPKEAARIFLQVKGVNAERLQDIDEDGVCDEGAERIISACEHMDYGVMPPEPCFNVNPCKDCIINHSYPELFGKMVWDKTIKPTDLHRYGWDVNPWVWVIEFERTEQKTPF